MYDVHQMDRHGGIRSIRDSVSGRVMRARKGRVCIYDPSLGVPRWIPIGDLLGRRPTEREEQDEEEDGDTTTTTTTTGATGTDFPPSVRQSGRRSFCGRCCWCMASALLALSIALALAALFVNDIKNIQNIQNIQDRAWEWASDL
jgi:hypothetical protein